MLRSIRDLRRELYLPDNTPTYTKLKPKSFTYDHRIWRTRDPVRSPLVKPDTAGLVVGSVTTSESLVLYVFSSSI